MSAFQVANIEEMLKQIITQLTSIDLALQALLDILLKVIEQ